jgi:fibronectin-binding autotransporter adhesin
MKTRTKNPTILSSIAAAVTMLAATSAFGQATFTWTNAAGGDIATAANWTPNGTPQPITGDPNALGIYGDEMLWDGKTFTDLVLTANTGQGGFSSGLPEGLRIRLSSNQTNSVTIRSVVATSGGTRLNSITIEPGAGAFHMGDPTTVNVWDFLAGASNPATHTWVNNSTNPVTIHPNVRHRLGAGGAHTFDFGGSGNWIVNNYFRNFNNAATLIAKSGTGTMTWTGTNVGSAVGGNLIAGPVTINDGTLVLKSPDLLAAQGINHNGGILRYDAPTGAGVLSGTINGVGALVVNAGVLTLSGANTFSGVITLSGGELIAGRAETIGVNGPLGQTGVISFAGGTLSYGPNNDHDYSGRFSTAASQNYRINTAGRNVTYATGLTSSGGTLNKLGSGTLTLAGANTFGGATTVSAGRLVIEGAFGSGAITVANSAALGVTAGGSSIAPTSLTVGTSGSATLEFNDVNSIVTPLIAAGSISAGGTITINVNSGIFAVGQSYPLFSWTSGSAPAVVLGNLVGAAGNLSTNGNTIQLNVTGLAYVWSGANNGNWDITTANNWLQNGVPATFANGSAALFDNTATGNLNVVLNSPVTPASTTVNSTTNAFSITSAGANAIGGAGGLTKNASSVLTLAGGANNYTGVTTINGGTISVGALANGGSPSDVGASGSGAANLVLNGGTLEYTGPAQSSDRLFTLGAAGGALVNSSPAGALNLNNAGAVALSGSGARTLTLSGANVEDNILAASLSENGGATALTKSGAGKWILSGNNAIAGTVTISGGTLQVGNAGASGSIGSGNILNNGALIFNRTGALTNGVVTGTGSVTVDGGARVVLPGNNTYSGGTTIQPGSILQVGNGGATGALNASQTIQNEGTLIFDTTGTHQYTGNGFIAGAGNVIVRGNGGLIKAIAANTYTGWTLIEPGATFQPTEGNTGQLLSSVVTNNGTLKFVSQDPRPAVPANIVGSGRVRMGANNFNAGSVNLTGTNTYTGGTFIGCNELIFGDGFTPGSGSLLGDVTFVNNFDTPDDNLRTLTFNRPDDFTFSGNITTNFTSAQNNLGRVRQMGPGVLTLTGNNNYAGGTLIDAGTIQVGNGGNAGSIGTGPVTDNGILVWNRSDDVTFGGVISGFGSFVKKGAGKLTLTGVNTYSGATTVSNGTLVVTSASLAADLYLEGGSFVGGAEGVVATNAIGGSIVINTGALVATLNTSLAASNTFYEPLGLVSANGGAIQVVNAGPTLVVGQKFTLFNQPVQNGNLLTVTGGGATWVNNLATDGSITVATVTAPPTLNIAQAGNNLQFTWSGSGYKLQAQTNSLSVGISNNWGDYPGGGTSPVSVPINSANGAVFFRLISTP